jgi:hypothetical protein
LLIKPLDFCRLFENETLYRMVGYDIFCLEEDIISHLINQNLDLEVE